VADVSTEPVVMNGELGIPLSELPAQQLQDLRTALTIETTPWDDQPSQIVECYRFGDDCIWIPRHFRPGMFWQIVDEWKWSLGAPVALMPIGKLDPERGQIRAVPEMIAHIVANKAGVLISPTGTGKTCMGFNIAAHFGRAIGIPVYTGHMIDHWIEDAEKFLGLSPDDVGIVHKDRCDLGKPVTIMMIQSLLARTYPQALYDQIGFLIGDEVNHFGAPQWKDTIAQFPATYRLGLSADPSRKDGLDPMIGWLFGEVGHTARRVRSKAAQAPSVIGVHVRRDYKYGSYCKWKKANGEWRMDEPHPSKYDNVVAADAGRSAVIAKEIVNAARTGRQIIVFSSRVDHLVTLRQLTRKILDPTAALEYLAQLRAPPEFPTTGFLEAGMKAPDRERVCKADIIFTTFQMARDALNVPRLDTEVFATQPGDPLQPIGRLREKAEGIDRRPLMVLEFFEDPEYSRDKWRRHMDKYRGLGMKVKQVTRVP
jgi:hypothetical protein